MNLISAVNNNSSANLEELQNEKEKCLKRLAEIYAEIARLEFVSAAVSYTAHFEIELPQAISLSAHRRDLASE
jgi:hypothetical protein